MCVRTGAAVTDGVLAGAAGGQRSDGQRGGTGHGLQVLSQRRNGRGLGVNEVRTGEVAAALCERAVPMRELDGHLSTEVET